MLFRSIHVVEDGKTVTSGSTAVAAAGICSLSNRLSALTGVVLLTALSLLTVEVELIELVELSGCIIICGLEVDTLDLVASVNSVDLDAVVDGVFFAVIVFLFLRFC